MQRPKRDDARLKAGTDGSEPQVIMTRHYQGYQGPSTGPTHSSYTGAHKEQEISQDHIAHPMEVTADPRALSTCRDRPGCHLGDYVVEWMATGGRRKAMHQHPGSV